MGQGAWHGEAIAGDLRSDNCSVGSTGGSGAGAPATACSTLTCSVKKAPPSARAGRADPPRRPAAPSGAGARGNPAARGTRRVLDVAVRVARIERPAVARIQSVDRHAILHLWVVHAASPLQEPVRRPPSKPHAERHTVGPRRHQGAADRARARHGIAARPDQFVRQVLGPQVHRDTLAGRGVEEVGIDHCVGVRGHPLVIELRVVLFALVDDVGRQGQ